MTWQQILADEKLDNIIPAVEIIYEEKSRLRANSNTIIDNCNFHFYDMHDAKMLYMITQHSSWARKHYPFLLCKCNRSDGVVNENHECKIINHDDQLKYYDRSKKDGRERNQKMKLIQQMIMQIGLMKTILVFHTLDCLLYYCEEKI